MQGRDCRRHPPSSTSPATPRMRSEASRQDQAASAHASQQPAPAPDLHQLAAQVQALLAAQSAAQQSAQADALHNRLTSEVGESRREDEELQGNARMISPRSPPTACFSEFCVGDPRDVFSRHYGEWLCDGIVVLVLEEAMTIKEGSRMPAGAVVVTYINGECSKWVPPEAFEAELRRGGVWRG